MIPPVGICLFGAAGGFGGDCPPFACMGLQASCSAVPRSPRVPVCFRACVRVTLAAHGRFLQSPAPSLGVCLCLLAFPHLSISIHISSITITLSLSPFSACDLSGSEFFPRGLLLLHPHGCSEGGQEGKAGERDPMGCCLTPPRPSSMLQEGMERDNREQNGKMRTLRTCRSLLAGGSGPHQTSGDNTTPRKDGGSGANPPGKPDDSPLAALVCPNHCPGRTLQSLPRSV